MTSGIQPWPSRKIVLATFGSLGDVHPFIALGLRLRAMGYEPVVAAPARHGPKVMAEGLGFCPMRPDAADLDRVLQLDGHKHEFLIRRVVLSALREGYDDLRRAMRGAAAAGAKGSPKPAGGS